MGNLIAHWNRAKVEALERVKSSNPIPTATPAEEAGTLIGYGYRSGDFAI
jgi:hypothetical protein